MRLVLPYDLSDQDGIDALNALCFEALEFGCTITVVDYHPASVEVETTDEEGEAWLAELPKRVG